MRLGVLLQSREPLSFRNYREQVCAEFERRGVMLVPLAGGATPAAGRGLDLLWDPGLGMGRPPDALFRSRWPAVATVHGLRAFSLPLAEIAVGLRERLLMLRARFLRRREWRRLLPRLSAIIAVSRYGAEEVVRAVGADPRRVHAIHHGVARGIFRPEGARQVAERPYFLHVSSYQPKKNVDRILAAHAMLDPAQRPALHLVVPGHPERRAAADVRFTRDALAAPELAELYRGAHAFVFPSLHETFGMPILEAMACGCPVLTSEQTACREVAGDAALVVDPRSERALASALGRLATDDRLRAELSRKGLARAQGFSWERSAEQHLALFESVLRASR
jgi:glycosyltransferase involved in cell wall biosynthesis